MNTSSDAQSAARMDVPIQVQSCPNVQTTSRADLSKRLKKQSSATRKGIVSTAGGGPGRGGLADEGRSAQVAVCRIVVGEIVPSQACRWTY